MSERQFRRYRDRYEEAGEAGLLDRRLGKISTRRVPAEAIEEMLELYRHRYLGWNVKHFHEHLSAITTSAGATPSSRRSFTRRAWWDGPSGAVLTGASGKGSRARG